MTQEQMEVFVATSMNLLEKLTGEKGQIREGRLVFGKTTLLDFTGMVQIAGHSEGCVCLSMSRPMAEAMLASSGETEPVETMCRDLVGEATSIIASNARRTFGSTFRVAPPQTFDSQNWDALPLPYSRFVLPIRWREHEALLFFAIQLRETQTKSH